MSTATAPSFTRRQISPDGASWAMAAQIGSYLRQRREKDGVTQDAFARQHGIARTTYCYLERAEHLPTLDILILAARAYQLNVWQLLQAATLTPQPEPVQP